MNLYFVGCGNIGRPILLNLIKEKIFAYENIFTFVRNEEEKRSIEREIKCKTTFEINWNKNAVLFVAIKPQQANCFFESVPQPTSQNLIISIMAGYPASKIKQYFPQAMVVRAMPTFPIEIKQGMTAIYGKEQKTSNKTMELVKNIFNSLGKYIEVDTENELDIVTAVSGSGTGFVFYYMDAMLKAATKLGLPLVLAKQIIQQTFLGSAMVANTPKNSFSDMLRVVSSSKGTTIEGINYFKKKKLYNMVYGAIEASYQKAKKLNNN